EAAAHASMIAWGLPELDRVALGVVDPGEAAVAGSFFGALDLDAVGFQLLQEDVEVVDAVVDHVGAVEVGALWLEGRPDRAGEGGGLGRVTPAEVCEAVLRGRKAEVLLVPLAELLRVLGADEDAADSGRDAGGRRGRAGPLEGLLLLRRVEAQRHGVVLR